MEVSPIFILLAAACVITQFAGFIRPKSFWAQWISIASFVYGAIFQLKVVGSDFGFALGMALAAMILLKVSFLMNHQEPGDESNGPRV